MLEKLIRMEDGYRRCVVSNGRLSHLSGMASSKRLFIPGEKTSIAEQRKREILKLLSLGCNTIAAIASGMSVSKTLANQYLIALVKDGRVRLVAQKRGGKGCNIYALNRAIAS